MKLLVQSLKNLIPSSNVLCVLPFPISHKITPILSRHIEYCNLQQWIPGITFSPGYYLVLVESKAILMTSLLLSSFFSLYDKWIFYVWYFSHKTVKQTECPRVSAWGNSQPTPSAQTSPHEEITQMQGSLCFLFPTLLLLSFVIILFVYKWLILWGNLTSYYFLR